MTQLTHAQMDAIGYVGGGILAICLIPQVCVSMLDYFVMAGGVDVAIHAHGRYINTAQMTDRLKAMQHPMDCH